MDIVLAGDARDRRDVEDRAAASLLHDRIARFMPRKTPRALTAIRCSRSSVSNRFLDRAAGEPRVFDEDVELPDLGEGVVDGRRECARRWSRSRSMPGLVWLRTIGAFADE
jgi:hypothetical protein